MEFKINSSPHLKMSEITKQLFNRNFHADVQFSVEGKIIYAHSLELIKRSTVFEQQLEDTMGDTKLIPITGCKYESFLEFVRYVYTDECIINDDNFVDILRLAIKYKFIKLENQVLSLGKTAKWVLKFFEYSIRDKYDIAYNFVGESLAESFGLLMMNKQFLSLDPDAVDVLLKFERIEKSVTELQIFTAVAEWISAYCKTQQITLSEGRQHFDKLIRKIRFPILSVEELRECYTKFPGLLTDSDRMSIASQTVFGGGSNSENGLWNSKVRDEFIALFEWRTFQQTAKFNTIFSVSNSTILRGLRIGIEQQAKPIGIEISETDENTNTSEKLSFVQNPPDHFGQLIISLGESIRLKANFKYTISVKYLEIDGIVNVVCRKEITDVIINDPGKTVNLIHASANMVEMFFNPAISVT